MKSFLIALLLLSSIPISQVSAQTDQQGKPVGSINLVGRWRVKFTITGGTEKNLMFVSNTKGAGYFHLLDTGPDDKPAPHPLPAVWVQLKDDRVSFSGEAELPIGNCCRELGTVIFKGKFRSGNTISGKLIFVTNIDEEESPYRFRSTIGTFTATRLPN